MFKSCGNKSCIQPYNEILHCRLVLVHWHLKYLTSYSPESQWFYSQSHQPSNSQLSHDQLTYISSSPLKVPSAVLENLVLNAWMHSFAFSALKWNSCFCSYAQDHPIHHRWWLYLPHWEKHLATTYPQFHPEISSLFLWQGISAELSGQWRYAPALICPTLQLGVQPYSIPFSLPQSPKLRGEMRDKMSIPYLKRRKGWVSLNLGMLWEDRVSTQLLFTGLGLGALLLMRCCSTVRCTCEWGRVNGTRAEIKAASGEEALLANKAASSIPPQLLHLHGCHVALPSF